MVRTKDAVITHLRAAARQNMLEKALKELYAGDGAVLKALSPVIAIAKPDLPIRNGFQPIVGDGDAEDIAAEVVQNLFAGTGMLAMHDPRFVPHIRRNAVGKTGLSERGSHLGAEDQGEGTDRNEKLWIFRFDPAIST